MFLLFYTMVFSGIDMTFDFVLDAKQEEQYITDSFDVAEKNNEKLTQALNELVGENNEILDGGEQYLLLYEHFKKIPNETKRAAYFLLMSAIQGTPEASQEIYRIKANPINWDSLYIQEPNQAAKAKQAALMILYQAMKIGTKPLYIESERVERNYNLHNASPFSSPGETPENLTPPPSEIL